MIIYKRCHQTISRDFLRGWPLVCDRSIVPETIESVRLITIIVGKGYDCLESRPVPLRLRKKMKIQDKISSTIVTVMAILCAPFLVVLTTTYTPSLLSRAKLLTVNTDKFPFLVKYLAITSRLNLRSVSNTVQITSPLAMPVRRLSSYPQKKACVTLRRLFHFGPFIHRKR